MNEEGDGHRVLFTERIYEGRVINLRKDHVRLESGSSVVREVVEHRGSVGIVPLLDDDRVLLVEQYRYAVDEWLLEIPAGTLESGEDPEWCAARELEEETGYTASRFRRLFTLSVSPGYCNEVMHVFVAEGLRPGVPRLDADEELNIRLLALRDIPAMMQDGRIRDAKTIASLLAVLISR